MPRRSSPAPRRNDTSDDQTRIREALVPSPGGRRDRAQLIVLAGENLGQTYHIEAHEVVIGRSTEADIRLDDAGISRRHARLRVREGNVTLEDLESANGTFVNGSRIREAALRDGDNVHLGSDVILKFTFSDELEENFRQRMHAAAIYDPLTQACNRRHFVHQLESEISYARRHGTALSLLMLDIDHFKKINDSHGHLGGDYVLATLGQIVSATLRTEDLFARFGGEEFAVLCRGTTADEALMLAERLRASIETFAFEHRGLRIPVTVSVGVASWFEQPNSDTQLIANADGALYKAKDGGRNRVVVRAFRPA
jgi:diguanylate cyclase (GGDEF)-like protein